MTRNTFLASIAALFAAPFALIGKEKEQKTNLTMKITCDIDQVKEAMALANRKIARINRALKKKDRLTWKIKGRDLRLVTQRESYRRGKI